jgi:hypothetical protein
VKEKKEKKKKKKIIFFYFFFMASIFKVGTLLKLYGKNWLSKYVVLRNDAIFINKKPISASKIEKKYGIKSVLILFVYEINRFHTYYQIRLFAYVLYWFWCFDLS